MIGTLAVLFASLPAGREWGSTRVLLQNAHLWYCFAIALKEASMHYGAVWARFVLVTSAVLFCRFSTLLTRLVKRASVDRIKL